MPEATPGDPIARQSPLLFWLFGWYLRWLFYRRFYRVRVSRLGLPVAPPGRPIIVCTNHPSWWDPAFFILLQTKLFPGRVGFGPMDAASLGRYGVLERMGVFGVALDSPRGAARFLAVSLRVLADPRRMLWITGQGAFSDPRERPIRLRPGIAHLARRLPDAVILPLALEYTFWNEGKPEALARFGTPIDAGRDRSVGEWTALLEAELTRTVDALAAESMRRDPRLFRPLVRGGAGIGPVYNTYRRVRAFTTGQAFDASHGGGE
ncbi:MAG: hypothetical protein NVSMB18_00090 [Acetobacteraceae bacterium]